MPEINFHKLFQGRFRSAKAWHILAECTSLTILIVDIIVIFTERWSILLTGIVVLMAVMNTVCIWLSDRQNDLAQLMLRKFELFDSLGWKISNLEVADWLVGLPNRTRLAVHSIESDPFFASHEPAGTKRMMKNLEESAFWSKHEARWMFIIVLILGIITLLFSLVIGAISLEGGTAAEYPGRIADTIIAIFTFVFSGGYFRLAFEYKSFADQAHECKGKATQLLQGTSIPETDAVKTLMDYQIARATAPILPDWIYLILRKRLNEIWKEMMGLTETNSSATVNET